MKLLKFIGGWSGEGLQGNAGRGRLEVVIGLQTRATQNERSLTTTVREQEWFGLDLPWRSVLEGSENTLLGTLAAESIRQVD